jgi:hypothetical protein
MSRFHSQPLGRLDGPPPEVLDEVDAAWERAQELRVDGPQLHFEVDLLHRVWGELRHDAGSLERRLSASEALAIACGSREPALLV